MLDQPIADKFHLQKEMELNLHAPYFAEETSLWVKNPSSSDCGCPNTTKRYIFTKLGKTLGLQITRYLSLFGHRLYYFQSPSSEACLGSCQLENTYFRWIALESKHLLVLSNGIQSTCYFFDSNQFYLDNQRQLNKNIVQLDFYNQFQVLEELGEGAYSTVCKVRHRQTGELLSAKSLALDTPKLFIHRELQVLREIIGAPHVSQYWGLFETNNQLILLTQFVQGRDLMTVINYSLSMTYDSIKTILSGISKGLKECHKRKIIHRDIKPQNVVVNLDTMQPTIIDFGMALDLKTEVQFSKCGTLAYMAPEVYKCENKPTHTPYNCKSDQFSLGVIAHLLMTGENPLKNTNNKGQPFDRTLPVHCDQQKLKNKWGEAGLEMVKGLLNEDPCSRWSGAKLLSCAFLNQQKRQSDSFSTIEDPHLTGSI